MQCQLYHILFIVAVYVTSFRAGLSCPDFPVRTFGRAQRLQRPIRYCTDCLDELRPQLQRDIVIFTDKSTYGLSRSVYAADFYDFNGYGIGDDREGICLMICMDPEDRGWWACCTGPETMSLYTEVTANQIDDILYNYMSDGDYGTGVSDWIENIRRMYTEAGSRQMLPDGRIPDASLRVGEGSGKPAWYPKDCAAFPFYHDADAPRVIDNASYFTDDEKIELETRLSELRTQLGRDIVVLTDSSSYGFSDRRPDLADASYLTASFSKYHQDSQETGPNIIAAVAPFFPDRIFCRTVFYKMTQKKTVLSRLTSLLRTVFSMI